MNEQYEFSNPELATLAVYNLGGTIDPVDLEDVALELYQYAPKKFSWRKYPERIDLRIVQYSINDAIKKDIGYLKGNSRYGYMVTEIGLSWVTNVSSEEIVIRTSRKFSTSDIFTKEIDRMKRTVAYQKYASKKANDITIRDFQEFTRTNDYFPSHLILQKFLRIKNITDNDIELHELWDYLSKLFIREDRSNG